jgi:hypothetical protein
MGSEAVVKRFFITARFTPKLMREINVVSFRSLGLVTLLPSAGFRYAIMMVECSGKQRRIVITR